MLTRLPLASAFLVISTSAAQAQGSESGCERSPRAGRGAVYGAAQDSATRLPVQELKVQLAWQENGRRRTQEQHTDRMGLFRFCDAPSDTRLVVEAGRESQSVVLEAGESHQVALSLNAPKSAIAGRVIDDGSGRGVTDAEVRVRDSQLVATTRADGTFQLPDLPAGVHWLSVSHVAYEGRQDSLQVQQSTRLQLTIRLAQTVIVLKPIEVQVRSRVLERAGYYERQERGFGRYLSRFDWENRSPRLPSDLMRTVAGVRVVPLRAGVGSAVLDRSNCAFRYVLDGARIGSTFNIDDIPVEWIEALEVYRGPAEVPAQFTFPPSQARANCGVIVIWTRGAR
jgi:Carboxypeptidase regulatory-like domain